jgi:magnesium-transporting ATPase (P-type)
MVVPQSVHEVLNVLDFSSDRARMSIIVRAQDGTIRLHCKGSDAALLPRLSRATDTELLQRTHTNLHDFSVKVPSSAALADTQASCSQ